MKIKLSTVIIMAFISFAGMIACQKVDNDRIPPTIILKGSNPLYMIPGCQFIEPGYYLTDDKTGQLNMYQSPDHIPDSVGVYVIRYFAYDADSNYGFAERRVIIEPVVAANFAGTLLASDSLKPIGPLVEYEVTGRVLVNDPPLIELGNFNNFGNNFRITFSNDEEGSFQIQYSLHDTIITGDGLTFCDNTGFRIDYLVTTPGKEAQYHGVSYLFPSIK